MPELFTILAISFLLGIRHATDGDHVVAITAIIAKKQRGILSSIIIGAFWGIGHSITVTLIGIPIILKILIIPAGVGRFLELIVGFMLIILGFLNFTGILSKLNNKFTSVIIHKHPHSHKSDGNHAHFHFHLAKSIKNELHHLGLFQIIRPTAVGIIHGLAGSAAIALLILATIQNTFESIIYLFIFHIGVLFGMMLITTFIGISVTAIGRKSLILNQYLTFLSGILSIIFGMYIVFRIYTGTN